MLCECEKYQDLELYRESIDKRIKETKRIKKNLDLIAGDPKYHSQLWKCLVCNQFWQSNEAWNWGAKEYVYKVPEISIEDWLKEAFVKPDELLIYSAILQNYEDKNTFFDREVKCRNESCNNNAIEYSVFCKQHHIESLQNGRGLPPFPKGRMFKPYS